MSTRLRPIVMINDSVVVGGNARLALENTAKVLRLNFPPRGSMPEDRRLIEIFHSIVQQGLSGRHWLWLFREPRNTSPSRSRYVQLCQYYGIGPYIAKKKKSTFDFTLERILATREQERIARETAARLAGQAAQAPDWYQPIAYQNMAQQAASQTSSQPLFVSSGFASDLQGLGTTMAFRWSSPEEEQP